MPLCLLQVYRAEFVSFFWGATGSSIAGLYTDNCRSLRQPPWQLIGGPKVLFDPHQQSVLSVMQAISLLDHVQHSYDHFKRKISVSAGQSLRIMF